MIETIPLAAAEPQNHQAPLTGKHVKTYEEAYDQSRQFLGLVLGKIFTPQLESDDTQDGFLFGGDRGANDMQNYFREGTFGEALSYDPAFHPFVAQMADQLLMLQEAKNG